MRRTLDDTTEKDNTIDSYPIYVLKIEDTTDPGLRENLGRYNSEFTTRQNKIQTTTRTSMICIRDDKDDEDYLKILPTEDCGQTEFVYF